MPTKLFIAAVAEMKSKTVNRILISLSLCYQVGLCTKIQLQNIANKPSLLKLISAFNYVIIHAVITTYCTRPVNENNFYCVLWTKKTFFRVGAMNCHWKLIYVMYEPKSGPFLVCITQSDFILHIPCCKTSQIGSRVFYRYYVYSLVLCYRSK